MNKRERNLLTLTLIIIVLGVGSYFVLGDTESLSFDFASSGELESVRQKYEEYIQIKKDEADINSEFQSIGFDMPEKNPGQSSGETFSNQVNNLLVEHLNGRAPQMGKPAYSEIPNVSEYCFVDITADIDGTLTEMLSLLKLMDSRGLLIKSFRLDQKGGGYSMGTGDGEERQNVSLHVIVSRLVKQDEETQQWIKRSFRRTRKESSSD